ncbi:MAG TPA: peptidylprolyl isomerase [Myxococcales bacterium]|nr:peptidylprolyl isomerase [Myxococcales bacterium]
MRRTPVFLLALLVGAACEQSHSEGHEKPSGPAVATMDDDAITVEAFEKHLKEQSPFIRAQYTTLDKKKEFLDGMIRFQLLSDEARKEGFDKDPEVVSTLDKIMVQRLIHKKFGDEGGDSLPESDLRAYYEQHKTDYVKPERVRLQVIEFQGASPTAAKKELAALRAARTDLAAFGTFAAAHSDDAATKGRNGDTDYHTLEELTVTYGPDVSAAASELKQINQLSDAVRGKDGWYLLKLIGRQAALNRTFEQVRPALQSRLWHERQNKAFDDYVKELRDKAHVVVHDDELAKVDASVPSMGGNGPRFPLPGRAPSSPPIAATPPGRRPPGMPPPPPFRRPMLPPAKTQ